MQHACSSIDVSGVFMNRPYSYFGMKAFVRSSMKSHLLNSYRIPVQSVR